jgi:hypothetical protein
LPLFPYGKEETALLKEKFLKVKDRVEHALLLVI